MSSKQPVIADLLTWRAASKRSSPRWPALIGVAGTVVMLLNLALRGSHELEFGSVELDTLAAACLFGSLAFATFPVWYFDTDRLMQGRPRLSWMKKLLVCSGLFLVALVLSPTFSIAVSKFDEMQHSTTTWVKRSLLESVERPFYGHDELVWAGTGTDTRYIPPRVFCPSYSVRLYPLFGLQRGDNWPGVLEDSMSDVNGQPVPPDHAVLQAVQSRCEREGLAMLNAGYTKESALMRGDIGLFFSRLASEEGPARQQVVLEEAQIPPGILKKVEVLLAAHADDEWQYVDSVDDQSAAGGSKPPITNGTGVTRRLKPVAIAAALGRTKDIALSEAKARQ